MIDEQRLDRIRRHEQRGRDCEDRVADGPPPQNGARNERPDEGASAAPTPGPRWITPLGDFLGDEEPSDDDSADWIIRDLIPRGEAALIAGPPKCGKTWSALSLAIDVALGQPWLDTFDNALGEPARVLVLAFEDSQRRLGKRVWELARGRGISPTHPTLRNHLSISRTPLAIPGDERVFADELRAWRPALVLIDNLTRVMVGDQNAIKDAKRFSDTWCKLCSDVEAAVVFLHHTSKVGAIAPDKRGQGDPFESIRGSGDLVASARHLVLTRPLEAPGEDKLADVRMRGNLDLRREDFVLAFERAQDPHTGRWITRLADRGDGDEVRARLAADRRATKEATQRAERTAEHERRRQAAIELAQRNGSVSARTLATAVGLKSPAPVLPVLTSLVADGTMRCNRSIDPT
jgi:RecA-family ATPase